MGEATLYTGPLAGAAIGSAATNGIRQGLNIASGKQDSFDVTSLAVETGIGALSAKLGSVAAEKLSRTFTGPTASAIKGKIGEAASNVYNRLKGATLVDAQVKKLWGTRTTADFVFSKDGVMYAVEAKFGVSRLKPAQVDALEKLGPTLYHVERWGYDWVQRVGANLGFGASQTALDATRK